MAFPAQFLDELRARCSLPEVVGRRVQLRKKGREWEGLCPFHKEKTPSFTVNDEKGFYHCFGCGEHGGVFDFVMKTDGLSFPETVERLATDAGMQVPQDTPEERH
ncbi:MAG: DNA primase, partial [Rhodospirillales bacterium]|nr:DNA primase [Rhodospirillales bacterium]